MDAKRPSLLFPRGTWQTPIFFWRGGDVFKEAEHLQSELVTAQTNLDLAKVELEEARAEFHNVQLLLNNKEGQAIAIAESFGASSSSTAEHASLRRRVAELTLDMEDLDHKIGDAIRHGHPTCLAQLERERSAHFLEIANLDRQIHGIAQRIRQCKLNQIELLVSDDFHRASIVTVEHEIGVRIHEFLRSQTHQAFEAQNCTETPRVPVIPVDTTSTDARKLQLLLNQRMDLEADYLIAHQQRAFAQIRRRVIISALLDDIALLDAALQAIGQESLNVEQLRQSYLPEGPFSPLATQKMTASALGMGTRASTFRSARGKSGIRGAMRTSKLD
jgi:hypothetical protein